jgi:hypothetical protein
VARCGRFCVCAFDIFGNSISEQLSRVRVTRMNADFKAR